MIHWEERYTTGSDAIDRQHKTLFLFFNDFEKAINEGYGDVYLNSAMNVLEAYAKAHFNFEENCMHEHQCPVAEKNKVAHEVFMNKFLAFKKRYDSGQRDELLYTEMHEFIESWIRNHIIGIDSHLKACMKS